MGISPERNTWLPTWESQLPSEEVFHQTFAGMLPWQTAPYLRLLEDSSIPRPGRPINHQSRATSAAETIVIGQRRVSKLNQLCLSAAIC